MQTELDRYAQRRVLRAGETIVREGEYSFLVGTVVRGALRMQRTSRDGHQQIVGLLMAGDTFGRPFSETVPFAIEAASDTTLCCFNKGTLEHLLSRHPELEHRMFLSALNQLDMARDWMIILGGQSVAERIASFFLFLNHRQPSSTAVPSGSEPSRYINVPISRRDIAAFLSTTVETISRTVHSMADKSILRILSPSRFEITDRRRLIDISGAGDLDFCKMGRFGSQKVQRGSGSHPARTLIRKCSIGLQHSGEVQLQELAQ
ncbi:Crp/Fnr family transcriptional regulator [Roseibium litorale]|uniref:Crp/Fnr family transcriptional regulator n=1 Tax=Roseibium litorale TaxID=2803841 RepID=UPI001FE6B687|nr:Crp/Fnr family transcriptional regulator [Roseibium litorale]